jgi:hypothetical protein
MLLVIDGDPIVYRAGFAGEDNEYHVVFEDEDGVPHQRIFERTADKTALKNMREWEEGIEPACILDVEKVLVPEPLENVLYTVKAILRDTRYAVAEKFDKDPDEVSMRVLLSGPGNFRIDLATVAPYKGNRKEATKPHWYQQIRNYLMESWAAEVIEGREADDECSILQAEHGLQCVVASIDKDLDQCPGHHYDYVRKTFYFTKPSEGEALFYKQILSGDSTDNIPGCYKVGKVKAEKIVDEYLLENPNDWEGLWKRVCQVYSESIDKHGDKCPYYEKVMAEQDVYGTVLEMARLVKMQEYIGQLWNPPGVEDGLLNTEFES